MYFEVEDNNAINEIDRYLKFNDIEYTSHEDPVYFICKNMVINNLWDEHESSPNILNYIKNEKEITDYVYCNVTGIEAEFYNDYSSYVNMWINTNKHYADGLLEKEGK